MTKAIEFVGAKSKASTTYSRRYNVSKAHVILLLGLAVIAVVAWLVTKNMMSSSVKHSPVMAEQQSPNSITDNNEFKLRIRMGETGFAFNKQVQLTLDKIQADKDGSKYTLSATVIFPDNERVGIRDAKVNYLLSYPRKAAFEIEVLDIQETSALFSIRKVSRDE